MDDTEPFSLFDEEEDAETAARLDAEAEADIAAGRVVPHEKVVKWLESWGTPNELPCPTPDSVRDRQC
jgi:predicted transcriptional regulator